MDLSTDQSSPNSHQPGHLSALSHSFRNMVRRLIGFFTLTEEDRSKAGIDLGGEGRDR
jgi:hypothetical protein